MNESTMTVLDPVGAERQCVVSWRAIKPHAEYEMHICLLDSEARSISARDVFECLCEIRRVLEPVGWRFLCNGARRDAWPSGMARDMGQGLKVYILSKKPLTSDNLVETLDPASPETVATLAEQRAYATKFFGYKV